MKLFPASGPLESIAIKILGPLVKATNGNPFLVILTDQYFKLARAVPTSRKSATHISFLFYDHSIAPYGASAYLLTENGKQFASKLFETICSFLGLKHLTAFAYHPRGIDMQKDTKVS